MKEVERRGVLIDVCPECKGVWLDRGELEKLLAAGSFEEEEGRRGHGYHEEEAWEHKKKRKKRRGLLGELFDLDIFD